MGSYSSPQNSWGQLSSRPQPQLCAGRWGSSSGAPGTWQPCSVPTGAKEPWRGLSRGGVPAGAISWVLRMDSSHSVKKASRQQGESIGRHRCTRLSPFQQCVGPCKLGWGRSSVLAHPITRQASVPAPAHTPDDPYPTSHRQCPQRATTHVPLGSSG